EELRVFQGTQRPVLAAAMSPDMKFVVTGLDDGTAHVWDARSGKEVTTLEEGHEYLTSTAAFFPDGERLLTAGGDDTTRIWSVRRGIEEQVLRGTGRRGLVALSSDGTLVLTGASGKRAKLWDVANGREIHAFDPHEATFRKRLQSNPRRTPEEVRKLFPEISALALSPDNQVALTGDSAGRCVLWDVASGAARATLRGHSQSISAAQFLSSPNDVSEQTHLITASTDGIVHQWNLTTNEYRRDLALKHRYPVMSMAVSPDGKFCLTASAAGPEEGGLWLWELATATLIRHHVIPNRTVQTVTFDAGVDGKELSALVTTTDEQGRRALLQWDIDDDKLATYWNRHPQLGSLWTAQYTPDRTHLLTVGGKGARLWNETTGRQTTSFRPQAAITAVSISPSSDRIATGSRDAMIKLWSLDTGKATHNLTGAHTGEITSLQFSPDGATLLTAARDGLAVLWNAATGERLEHDGFSHADGSINAAVFSPDEIHLLTAGRDADE
ncbi:MAG: WD40 repeat domain-containing protein, partial [Pirellulaceae bacterium]